MQDLAMIFPSELRIMKLLWEHGDLRAAQIADALKDEIGWNRNTAYTVIKKCVGKGFIQRVEPQFVCHALVTLRQVRESETKRFIRRLYGGDPFLLLEITQEMLNEGKF